MSITSALDRLLLDAGLARHAFIQDMQDKQTQIRTACEALFPMNSAAGSFMKMMCCYTYSHTAHILNLRIEANQQSVYRNETPLQAFMQYFDAVRSTNPEEGVSLGNNDGSSLLFSIVARCIHWDVADHVRRHTLSDYDTDIWGELTVSRNQNEICLGRLP